MDSSRDIKRLYLTLKWQGESLVAKILKSSMDTIGSKKDIWSFNVVKFSNFDFLPVKGETSECSTTLTLEFRHVSL